VRTCSALAARTKFEEEAVETAADISSGLVICQMGLARQAGAGSRIPFKIEPNPWNWATPSRCGPEPLVSAELDRFGSRFPPIGAAKGRVRAKSFVRGSGTGMMG